MERLHILPPDIVTRVSEYVDEIVSFVEKIEDNGFAYEGGGSVWFDVAKFEGAEGDGFRHEYAKLQPGSKGNKKLIDEGEGESSCLVKMGLMGRCIDSCSRQETSCRLCFMESKIKTRRTSLAIP
jgi:cysteinyl-tRNA synthetase